MTIRPNQRTVLAFDGSRIPLRASNLGGDLPVSLGQVYCYDNGQSRIRFMRGADSADWFVWSEKRQQRLASYDTRRELAEAFERSNNTDGAYRCAALSLSGEK